MNSWLFQGNPDYFRMDEYLTPNCEVTWAVRQPKVEREVAVGDEVFIWRAAGASQAVPGVVAVWAYDRTYGDEVSKRLGSPVSTVAVAIGRAVSGVYNKVMNFRSIDPRDQRAGMDSTNRVDHEVWAEFYDEAAQRLNEGRLESEFSRLWGVGAPVPVAAAPAFAYRDFGQPPDDDPADLQTFARKVRRGQRQFRE